MKLLKIKRVDGNAKENKKKESWFKKLFKRKDKKNK